MLTACRLRTLELGSCAITDEGLSKLVRTCHSLTALSIGQCSHVTDTGLSLVAENLQNLESIDLYGCTKITTVGLQQIMKLPKLSTLNLGLWHKWWSDFCHVRHSWWSFEVWTACSWIESWMFYFRCIIHTTCRDLNAKMIAFLYRYSLLTDTEMTLGPSNWFLHIEF